LMVMNRK